MFIDNNINNIYLFFVFIKNEIINMAITGNS